MDFALEIENWYVKNKRDLPWRDITNPYLIWVSEIILQQTRVVQGYDYYLRFVKHFPDVETLAAADEQDVLNVWQGLGYYSRARNLHSAAKTVAGQGRFPTTYKEVRALKGVGDYTAAAICSFAYGLPFATVDGNVYRVLSRFFGLETPIDTTAGKRYFAELAQQMLDKKNPGLYNQAIMDFGALQCTPKSPDCLSCPLYDACCARMAGKIDDFPVKSKKTAVRNRFFVYILIKNKEGLLMHRRGDGDIWQGLYEPYLLEFSSPVDEGEVRKLLAERFMTEDFILSGVVKGLSHVLTHRHLHVDCYELVSNVPLSIEGYTRIPLNELDAYPMSRLIHILFEKYSDMGLFQGR